jgi:HEAT repeat protein
MLAEDPVADVQIQASVGLFMTNPEAGLTQVLVDALMGKGIEPATVFRVFNAINRLPPEERLELVKPFLDSSSVTVRSQAVLRWLQFHPNGVPTETLLLILNNPASEVRQQAVRYLSSRPVPLDPSLLFSLPNSPFEDVRRQALALSVKSSPADQNALALRLLMDTVPAIRVEALWRIIQLRPPNWSRILRASLRDPAPEVRRATAQALLDNLGPEGQQIAADFARDFPDADISSLIRLRLGLN